MLRKTLTLAIALCLAGCTALQPVADLSAAGLVQRLGPGDRVRVLTRDQQQVELKITAIEADVLRGTTPDGRALEIPIGSISALEKKVIAKAATTWLVLGLVGVAAIAASASSNSGTEGDSTGDDPY